MTTLANVPAVVPLGHVELDLLRRASDGRLSLTATDPEIEDLYDRGLLRPHGDAWDLGRGVSLCPVHGEPVRGQEPCDRCFLDEDDAHKRGMDL